MIDHHNKLRHPLLLSLLAIFDGIIIVVLSFYLKPVIVGMFAKPIPNDRLGISVGETMLGLDNADLNRQLDDITSLGIGWIRFDMEWDHIQATNSMTFNWADTDRLVAAANAHHIKLLPVLDYTPGWAADPTCAAQTVRCAPSDPALFDKFAQTAVARYSSQGISDWEIWNEPNLKGSWQPGADPAAYAALLKSAYIAIKTVEPSATIITGGLGPAQTQDGDVSPIDFLTQLYANGAQGYFDALGDHPYSIPAMPSFFATWNAWSQMASTTPSLLSIMTANGDGDKRIWMTEYGATTGGPGVLEPSATDTLFKGSPDHVSEALQALMISSAITLDENYPWAGPIFIDSYRDIGSSESNRENFFGIVRFDGSTKPAYAAIKALALP